jgi:hypothetical protein
MYGNGFIHTRFDNTGDRRGSGIDPFKNASNEACDGTDVNPSSGLKLQILYRLIELHLMQLPFKPESLWLRGRALGDLGTSIETR